MASNNKDNHQSIKMVLLDDRSMSSDLERAGYKKMGVAVKAVTKYEELRTALLAATSHDPVHIIVINLDYGRVDGVQVVKHLKSSAEPTLSGVPIVVTSVQTAAKLRNSALDAGADLFVEQPLPRQYFIEKIKQLLEQKTRITQRVDAQGSMEFKVGKETIRCPIADLSMSGVLASCNLVFDEGTQVELSLSIPDLKKDLSISGEIVRTIRGSKVSGDSVSGFSGGIGIRFTKFHGDSESKLGRYIAKTSGDDKKLLYYL